MLCVRLIVFSHQRRLACRIDRVPDTSVPRIEVVMAPRFGLSGPPAKEEEDADDDQSKDQDGSYYSDGNHCSFVDRVYLLVGGGGRGRGVGYGSMINNDFPHFFHSFHNLVKTSNARTLFSLCDRVAAGR